MSQRIRFAFEPVKAAQVLAYLADKGVSDLTKLKAAKLLYFADKIHLLTYGRPILGDRYVSMEHGPVPSETLNLMNSLISPDEIEEATQEQAERFVTVHRHFVKHPRFRSRGTVDLDRLSQAELETLDRVFQEYGRKTVGELIDLTHQERAWQISNQGRPEGSSAPMPYELFFKGAPAEAQAMREWVEAHQEDRDFLAEFVG